MYYQHLDTIRKAMEALLAETIACDDAPATKEAQLILDCFDDSAADLFALIDEANADDQLAWDEDGNWRASWNAALYGMGEAA